MLHLAYLAERRGAAKMKLNINWGFFLLISCRGYNCNGSSYTVSCAALIMCRLWSRSSAVARKTLAMFQKLNQSPNQDDVLLAKYIYACISLCKYDQWPNFWSLAEFSVLYRAVIGVDGEDQWGKHASMRLGNTDGQGSRFEFPKPSSY